MGLRVEGIAWFSRFVQSTGDIDERTCVIIDAFSFEVLRFFLFV